MVMSSPRDPRALEIRGDLLYSNSHLKLPCPHWAAQLSSAQRLRKIVDSIQLPRDKVMLSGYTLKETKTLNSVARFNRANFTKNFNPESWLEFPKSRGVSRVGQEKLQADLQWPGRRRGRRRRMTGPGSCPNTDTGGAQLSLHTSAITQQTQIMAC